MKKGKTKAREPDEASAAARKKGKRKAATSDDNDDIEVVEQPKRQKTGRAESEMKEMGTTARTKTKPRSRTVSKQPFPKAATEEKDDTDLTQKLNAKKRKINIFPTGNEAIQFSFGTMPNVYFFFSSEFWQG